MQHQRPITRKKRKKILKKRIFFITLFFLFVLFFAIFIYNLYFSPKQLFISPIAWDQSTELSKIEDFLQEKSISYRSIFAENDYYVLSTEEIDEVIISSKKDIYEQISSLQVILKRLKIEGKSYSHLDLRYDKPVITM